jgi:hypothetical protein
VADAYPTRFLRTHVDGMPVLTDEVLLSPLSKHVGRPVPYHGTRVLTLEDPSAEGGTRTVYGCADCPATGERGAVKAHRQAEHPNGSGRSHVPAEDLFSSGRIAAPGPAVMDLPLGEVLELIQHVEDWGEVLAGTEQQLAAARRQLADLKREHRAALTEARREKRAVEAELVKLRSRLKRMIGED